MTEQEDEPAEDEEAAEVTAALDADASGGWYTCNRSFMTSTGTNTVQQKTSANMPLQMKAKNGLKFHSTM